MAEIEDQGLLKGMTRSVRNQRFVDRTLLRGRTIRTMAAGFFVFEGASPDYYNVSGVLTTQYGFGGNLVDQTRVHGAVTASLRLWENGSLHKGPVSSGDVLQDPRAFFDPRSGSGQPTYTVSGDINVSIPSGQIKNFVF